MKRLLFLFLLLSTVAQGQRYFYSRPTKGGISDYLQIQGSDIPASINLTGTPTLSTTPALNDNSTKIATTAYVDRLSLNIGTTLQNIAGTLNISSTYPGQSSLTTLGTIGTGVWNGTDIAFSNIAQLSGLSVLGVTGSSTADMAAIAGTANQVLRVNGAGTSLAFGSIDLAQSATVGSSILPIANGGNGSSSFPGWLLASGGTFTGANTVIGSTSNTLTFRFPSLGTTTTEVFKLENNTAAALGAQQISPPLVHSGLGWGTTAGTSQPVKFKEYLLPVQSTVPTGTLTWESSIAGGAYATRMNLTSAGALTVTDGTSPIFITPSAGTLGFLAGGAIQTGGSTRIGISNIGTQTHAKTAQSSGNTNFITWTSPASTSQTASTEESQWIFDGGATLQFVNGTLANQRFTKFLPGTVAFTSASSATSVSTVSIGGPTTGGTNATLARTAGLTIETRALTNSTIGVGLDVVAPTGATTNLVAQFSGGTTVFDVIRTKGYTVATLPAGTIGDEAYVTDATLPTYLGLLTGGGSIVTPVFYNGTAWVSH